MTPNPELSEKDFIQEGYKKNPFPFWLWFFLLTSMIALIWGASNWYMGKVSFLYQESPFLQVTNREMSLFLWQNPEFMRINVKVKTGYLPDFDYIDKVTINVANVDQYVAAPPELLFRYHTWKRLISDEYTQRPISKADFQEFLGYAEEWLPQYWPDSPVGYIQLVKGLSTVKEKNLATLPDEILPKYVKMAFQGWYNFFKDGEAINRLKVTETQMREFLTKNPHYARNYWCNIVNEQIPDYLKLGEKTGDAVVPANESSSFLRVAIYNYLKLGV
ncbi:MAG: hypothetical protein WCF65_06655 [Parachlamydiaceae bacterium]